MNGIIDKEGFLEAASRVADVANQADPPSYHLFAGGGETIYECTWFALVAVEGTHDGEHLRERIAKKLATDPHLKTYEKGEMSITESSNREVEGP